MYVHFVVIFDIVHCIVDIRFQKNSMVYLMTQCLKHWLEGQFDDDFD